MNHPNDAASPTLVCLRSLVVGAVATTLGVTAHSIAGGLIPGPFVLLSVIVIAAGIAAPSLRSPASYRSLALLIGIGQAAVHLVLTTTAGHAAPHSPTLAGPAGSPTPQRGGGVRETLAVVPDVPAAGPSGPPHWVEHLAADATGTNAAMAVAHLVAAAGVAFWLWRGEQAMWTLIALLARRLLALTYDRQVVAARRQLPMPGNVLVVGLRPRGERRTPITRRGPPWLRGTFSIPTGS